MSRAAKSIFVFGIYMILLGLILLIVPNTLLAIFAMPTTDEVWIRVLGVVAGVFGYYYVEAARKEQTGFFAATVRGRPLIILCFVGLVIFDLAPPALILFGAIDLLGAVWTWWALRDA